MRFSNRYLLAAALTIIVNLPAAAQTKAWAWNTPQGHTDGSITLPSGTLVQNPTGGSTSVNQSVATEPPLLIQQGGISASKAVGLNTGDVWVYDTNYNAWIFIPAATFAAKYTYTSTGSVTGNAWAIASYTSNSMAFTYSLWCSSTAPWGGGGTGPTWNSIGGVNTYTASLAGTSGSIKHQWTFSGGPYSSPAAFVVYQDITYVTQTFGAITVATTANPNQAYGLGCGSQPGATASGSGTIIEPTLGSITALAASDPTGGANPLLLMCVQSGQPSCVLGKPDGSVNVAVPTITATYVFANAGARSFGAAKPGYLLFKDTSNVLYSIDTATGVTSTIAQIGAAVPSTYYLGLAQK